MSFTDKIMETITPYGFCPICGAMGHSRERRPNGNDRCVNDHTYPSDDATEVPKRFPAWPINSLIRDMDMGDLCPECGSSLRKNWKFWRNSKGCIQPLCENHEE